VLGVVVDAKHRFLDGRDDAMNDRKGQDLVLPLADDTGCEVDLGGELPGHVIDGAVTSPIGGIMAAPDRLLNREVGGDPVDDEVSALDEPPEVPIDTFRPVGRHRAVAQLLEPALEVEAIGNHPEVAGALAEPNKCRELRAANSLGAGHALGRARGPPVGTVDAGGNGPRGPSHPRVGGVQATPVTISGPTEVLWGGERDGQLRTGLGGREVLLDREDATEQCRAREGSPEPGFCPLEEVLCAYPVPSGAFPKPVVDGLIFEAAVGARFATGDPVASTGLGDRAVDRQDPECGLPGLRGQRATRGAKGKVVDPLFQVAQRGPP